MTLDDILQAIALVGWVLLLVYCNDRFLKEVRK